MCKHSYSSLLLTIFLILCQPGLYAQSWQSRFVQMGADGRVHYIPDEKGNIIPDFSQVGYHHGHAGIPDIAVAKTVMPGDDAQQQIQKAIDELSAKTPAADGFRGAILLKKGVYRIQGTIRINASGIVLRGEGNETKLIAIGTTQRSLISISGGGALRELPGSRIKITDDYVPVGAKSFTLAGTAGLKVGDAIVVYRPGTDAWIKDLQMDHIDARDGTKQWQANEYNLQFERRITAISGNKVSIDNPIVQSMETKYGGGEIFRYTFQGRIAEVGVEDLYCESEFLSDTAENHGWVAIEFNKIENGWVRNVTSRYFGNSCVHMETWAKNISVLNSNCFDAKSIITGSRRYSFANDGQQNLVANCHSTEGRHDYVTGARVAGPNVFYNCTAQNTHADIGPHHRWAMGTLYDNIVTDGEINIQDRGNWGSGHGWSGVNQVLWNCTVKRAAVQNPWVSGNNYNIGMQGEKYAGRLPGKPDGIWEGQNKKGLTPSSLFLAQVKDYVN
ncbi:MAG: hypothetical protein JO301_03555 [Chitinophagaceae bacterium]|nr:hypothetical protein [Chitinophagaceae bacterium]